LSEKDDRTFSRLDLGAVQPIQPFLVNFSLLKSNNDSAAGFQQSFEKAADTLVSIIRSFALSS
jgi:hypothetical protein